MKCPKTDCRGEMKLISSKYQAVIKCEKCSMRIYFPDKEETIKYFEEYNRG
jgi:hypothetical protein